MPIRDRLTKVMSPASAELRQRLEDEWRQPGDKGQPLIIQERDRYGDVRLHVVWDAWESIPPQERSELILDAYEAVHGEDTALNVNIAIGLTSDEAKRMNIDME